MTDAHAFLLIFMVCATPADEFTPCVDGEARARSCAAAERAVREGLRSGYTLDVLECRRVG
jgi:hypothetical protein